MKSRKRILVAPLDWGIGHATRCIPIINALIENNYDVILAADGRPMHLLSTEFPNLEMIRYSGYNIRYTKYLPMTISILLQIPKLLWNIRKEHASLAEIINDYKIDGVISDNRFGAYSTKVPSVYITHQLNIQSKYFPKIIRALNYSFIDRYDVCWIIDDKKNNLAGDLSTPDLLPKNTYYIGAQSRFNKKDVTKQYDFLAIISGPEPQRTIFEKGLVKALKNRHEKTLIILGKPESELTFNIGNITIKSHLKYKELNKVILESDLIICRPGYSTIMDLAKLNKSAFFIPTPGQTEQEYLANYFSLSKKCYTQKQSEFNFDIAIKESRKYSGLKLESEFITDWKNLFLLFKDKRES